MQHSDKFLKIVNDARARVKETTVADVKRRSDVGERFHLIDVREESEWAAGHVAGATHLSKGVIDRMIPDTNAKIILYCGGGYRSALAADSIQKMGYTNVESMDGGFRAWAEAKLPTAKG
jgi:rhodanese-related sulfurtransferase